MMQAPIDDDKGFALADLYVDYAGQIDARLPHQPAAEFDREMGGFEDVGQRLQRPFEGDADGADVERDVAGKVSKAKAAAQIDQRRRDADRFGQARRQREGGSLRLDDRQGIEILRAGENVPVAPVGPAVNHRAGKRRRAIGIHAERLGPPAHPHAGAFEVEVRVHPHRDARGLADPLADGERATPLPFGFEVQRDACENGRFQFVIALAWPGKADPRRVHPGRQRHVQFAARRDIEAVDLRHHAREQRGVGVRLDRIMEVQGGRHGGAEAPDLRFDDGHVIGEERRVACLVDQAGRAIAADQQHALLAREPGRDRSHRLHL